MSTPVASRDCSLSGLVRSVPNDTAGCWPQGLNHLHGSLSRCSCHCQLRRSCGGTSRRDRKAVWRSGMPQSTTCPAPPPRQLRWAARRTESGTCKVQCAKAPQAHGKKGPGEGTEMLLRHQSARACAQTHACQAQKDRCSVLLVGWRADAPAKIARPLFHAGLVRVAMSVRGLAPVRTPGCRSRAACASARPSRR